MIYDWKDTFTHREVDCEKVKKELDCIDSITPEKIVEKARKKGTELNKCFTWDNTKAAEYWRIEEARNLIGSIVMDIEDLDFKPRAFSSVKYEDVRFYVETVNGMKTKETRNLIYKEIQDLNKTLSRKLREFKDLYDYMHEEHLF